MTSARHAFLGLVLMTLGGQLCVLGYEIVVASRFGTGRDADALALGLTVTFVLANEISGWVSALVVPTYLQLRHQRGVDAAGSFVLRSGAMLVALTSGVAAIVAATAPVAVGALAPGLATDPSAARLFRLFLPLVVFVPVAAWLAGILHSHGRFVMPGMRQTFWYGPPLVVLLALGPAVEAAAVPMGMATGLMLFCALLGAFAMRHLVLPRTSARSVELQAVATSLLPLVLASLVSTANVSLERGIAARLTEGSLAALTYAFRMLTVPVNLFVLNASIMLLPALSLSAARGDARALGALLQRSLRLALVLTVPLAALGIPLAEPGIRLLLERGAFTAESTRATATALAWYFPAIVGMAGVHVLTRAFQALREFRRLAAVNIAIAALNMALMPTLTALLGFRGLPLAASLTWSLLFGAMLWALRARLTQEELAGILNPMAPVILAGGVALVCTAGAVAAVPSTAIGVVAGAAIGLGAYGLAVRALAPTEWALAIEFAVTSRQAAGT